MGSRLQIDRVLKSHMDPHRPGTYGAWIREAGGLQRMLNETGGMQAVLPRQATYLPDNACIGVSIAFVHMIFAGFAGLAAHDSRCVSGAAIEHGRVRIHTKLLPTSEGM